MPFDGFGTFIRLRSWIVDATNSVKIRADFHDDEDNNFAEGLSHCITKDGQTLVTQNIPLNSRRIISLADPIDPQDAATKDYADTKAPLAGDAPFTGDVTVKNDDPAFTLDGKDGFKDSIYGDKGGKHRWEIVLGNATAESGSDAGSDFELINYHDDGTPIGDVLVGSRATGMLTVKANPIAALGIATKQYVDAADATKMPVTGGTISGNLQINGYLQVASEIGTSANIYRFGAVGSSSGYIQWQGGGTYVFGGGGTVWHSGNLNPASSVLVTTARLISGGIVSLPFDNTVVEPPNGLISGLGSAVVGGNAVVLSFYIRYLQLYTTGWWTVAYA